MSTWVDRVRARQDDGFTLIEVIVSMIVVGLVATAFVPLLVSSARSSQQNKLNTTAKNLTQLRLDAMRNLKFHVDAQNGAYVDLLDYYYHDLNISPTTLPYTITGSTAANCSVTGQWVNSGTPPAGAPALPYYQTTFSPVCGFPSTNAGETIPASAGFTQVVYAQFLTSSSQPTPAATLTSMSYNSQVSGSDSAPAFLLGVTVVTSWSVYGKAHDYSSFTEIADNGNDLPLIASVVKSTAVRITSHAEDQSILEMGVGIIQASGTLSNTSSASIHALGAYARQVGTGEINGAEQTAYAPPDTDLGTGPNLSRKFLGNTGCGGGGWAQFGTTNTRNVSGTTSGGRPLVPSSGTGTVTAELDANGGGACAGAVFSNQLNAVVGTDPKLQLPTSGSWSGSMVAVADMGGNSAEMSGSGSLTASSAAGIAGAVTSTASMASTTHTAIFPGLSFVPAGVNTCGSGSQSCGTGLVNIFLSAASLQCLSGLAGGTTVASYTGYVTYYVQSGWKSVNVTWNGTSGTDPLAGISLAQQVTTYAGSPVYLSDYISKWSTTRALTTTSGGAGGNETDLPAAVSIDTAFTRVGDSGSQISIQVGQLGCVAKDNR